MKTTTFALALTTFAVLTTASAQLAQVRSPQAAEASGPLVFTLNESEIGSMSIRASAGPVRSDSPALMARGSGGGAGKASFSDLSFMLRSGKATPMLAKMCATGKHFPQAIITVRKAGGGPIEYYTIRLTDVMVSSYQFSPSSGGDRPMESLSLNFTKIEFDYRSKGDR